MEKPRKKPLRDIIKGREKFCPENAEYNQGIEDMSTWLEGEVPTVEEIEKTLINTPTNKGYRTQAEAIYDLITRKLTGKV